MNVLLRLCQLLFHVFKLQYYIRSKTFYDVLYTLHTLYCLVVYSICRIVYKLYNVYTYKILPNIL